jgi:hypothetical protein
MREKDYNKLRREIQEKCRQDIEALDRVWAMISGTSPGLVSSDFAGNGAGSAAPRIEGLADAIREVLPAMPETFTIRDVIDAIGRGNPELGASVREKPTSVSSALKRFEREKKITLTRVGVDKKPSEYHLVVAPPPPAEPAIRKVAIAAADDDIPF